MVMCSDHLISRESASNISQTSVSWQIGAQTSNSMYKVLFFGHHCFTKQKAPMNSHVITEKQQNLHLFTFKSSKIN